LLRRGSTLLLVRSRYPEEPEPLWTLPGGRQKPGEMLAQTLTREFQEEASLSIHAGDLAYVSESVDERAALHVVNCTFWAVEDDVAAKVVPRDPKVVEARFVPADEALELLRADVLRIPVSQALRRGTQVRYYSFKPEDIAIPFFGHTTQAPLHRRTT
jgi:8-oxo-dGTP diphosphatase